MAQTPAVFVAEGLSIPYTPGGAVAPGDVLVQGKLVGIATQNIAASALGVLCVHGIFNMPKDNSDITAIGTALYWDTNGSPVGGTALSGAVTTTATANQFCGWALEVAGVGVGMVRVLLRSVNDTTAIGLDNLTDVGTIAHGAGAIIVGDGAKFEEVAVSGDATLAATGAVTLNAAHQEQVVLVPIAALGAGADLSALTAFAHPRANTLTSLGYLSGGDGDLGTIADGSTSVFVVTDGAGNTVVSKTYNTGTQPTANALNDLGALDGTHKILTAGEILKLAITNGATAKTPAGFLVIRTVPTNA